MNSTSTPGAPDERSRRDPGDRGDVLLGEQLGPYRIERLLGEGGMGAVYLGIDEALERHAAIKVLSLLSPRWMARFLAEARNQARLDHPNIVSIYGAGSGEVRGLEIHYIALQYVEGSSLSEMVRSQGALDPVHATELILDAARGLYYVHSEGLIHRDVKPSNILVDLGDRALVSDFGVSLQESRGEDPTTRSEFMGTWTYASPEQLAKQPVDPRTDVFSLGATFHYSLTASEPGEVVPGEALPPGGRFPIDPALPHLVRTTLARMLANDPGERFGNMLECIDSLERALQVLREEGRQSESSSATGAQGVGRSRRPGHLAVVIPLVVALGLLVWALVPDREKEGGESKTGLAENNRSTATSEQRDVQVLVDALDTQDSSGPTDPVDRKPNQDTVSLVEDVRLAGDLAETRLAALNEQLDKASAVDAAALFGEIRDILVNSLGRLDRLAHETGDEAAISEMDRIALGVTPGATLLLNRMEMGPVTREGGDLFFDALPVTNLQYFDYLLTITRQDSTRFLAPLDVPDELSNTVWVEFQRSRSIRRPRLDHALDPVVALSSLGIESFASHVGKRLPTHEEWKKVVAPVLIAFRGALPPAPMERVLWDEETYFAGLPGDKPVFRRLLSVSRGDRAFRLVRTEVQ